VGNSEVQSIFDCLKEIDKEIDKNELINEFTI